MALSSFLDLLERWNGTYNLTAVRERQAMLSHHLADCLAAVPPLHRRLEAGRLLDVGSGGGLPGVVFAIMLPSLQVTCLDAVGKKVAFIRQAAAALGLPNLHAEHARVEAWHSQPFDVITSRAFSSLANLVQWTSPLLADDGCWLAMKAKRPDAEIDALPASARVFHVEPLVVPGLNAERCLVWIRRTSGAD